jgi:hypothetical protein
MRCLHKTFYGTRYQSATKTVYPIATSFEWLGVNPPEEAIFGHYVSLMGKPQVRSASINWTQLGYQEQDLCELENPFEEDEIKKVIMQLPAEKAPDPDGFIGRFYKKMLADYLF